MAAHDDDRREKKESALGEAAEAGLDLIGGAIDLGGLVIDVAGSAIGSAAEVAGGAAEAVGGVAGEAMSGCAGCLPVIALAIIMPMGLLAAHLLA